MDQPMRVSPAHAGMDRHERGARAGADGLPRPRGDGPRAASRVRSSRSSPPPTRGWTSSTKGRSPSNSVSPAHAGMDPRRSSSGSARLCLPRPRGDGPAGRRRTARRRGSPPPTRGWTLPNRLHHRVGGVSPAHAGMDPSRAALAYEARRLPRPRGDGPPQVIRGSSERESPPPTRGWTRQKRALWAHGDVSPAHAGMDPRQALRSKPRTGLPRPRGDGPCRCSIPPMRWASPPPTRGWTLWRVARAGRGAVSPAHAGMDPTYTVDPTARGSLPRPRGDGPAARVNVQDRSESPPPTRGWTLRRVRLALERIVSPAHAGMDPRLVRRVDSPGSLPRPRGDGPHGAGIGTRRGQSPPPTRGWTRLPRVPRWKGHVSPAHAGMDPARYPRVRAAGGLPRPRGDGPGGILRVVLIAPSPPPTRGWT